MNPEHPHHHPSLILFLIVASTAILRAQTVTPPAETPQKDAVVLSPFEVSSTSDQGYQPTAILQGGRGRIDLADVAGQVAVFSREFMEDIGVTTMDEAFLFSASNQT